ncbi:hypothetical protein COV04_02835 [Candidatus Uhrbacteria bacterium CG10_big_fil_rev_8_21_14_0_10_48_11]|uniref:Glycosyltransferase RgtA/B/C/D-like domain-containing protein n=1 Tax=Candidatus Uhrbacteria bacterium CG10_big_fil_rev_8_21_14_0_10_48_11 TaxID=1975037 RepID=A0A2M8LEK4_9BACT|nr:MAG: hypothetical protein COV04_02835 [Candidatus Uhrbacteria bacterium CG10_big_fil_rev_8_21_14_0_10_48_11]
MYRNTIAAIPPLLILGAITLNTTLWHLPLIGIVAALFYLLLYANLAGKVFVRNGDALPQTFFGFFILLACFSLIGTGLYYLHNLGAASILATLIMVALALTVATLRNPHYAKSAVSISISQQHVRPPILFFWAIMVVALAFATKFLLLARTSEAIRSPWGVIDPAFFTWYFLAAVAALCIIFFSKNSRPVTTTVMLGLLTMPATLLGVLVYRVGFGFDPFVHQATESLIATTGVVHPKPFYYIGQYALVVILHTLTGVSVPLLDTWLLPTLSLLLFPTALFGALRSTGIPTKIAALTSLLLLALPRTAFIATTPQGLADLVFVIAIFLYYRQQASESRTLNWLLILLALVALAIHPLAGLPALFLVCFHLSNAYRPKSRTLYGVVTTLAALTLPLILFLQNSTRAASKAIATLPTVPAENVSRGLLYLEEHYHLLLDGVYLYAFNLQLILLLLAASGVYLLIKQKQLRRYYALLTLSVILLADAVAVQHFIPFSFLIDYERGNFTGRIFFLAFVSLLPFVAVSLNAFFARLLKAPRSVMVFFILFISALATAGVYLSYPRFDTYQFDRGYSTSVHDVSAVNVIDSNATGDYVVLADQAVAAAALKELGFQKYFAPTYGQSGEPIFFYPIPTGGLLYQDYLKMVYEKADRGPIDEALTLTGASEAYFVLNDYWFDFEKIRDTAKLYADDWQEIDGGKLTVFHYTKK